MRREMCHVINMPIEGDVFELTEMVGTGSDEFPHDVMIRIVSIREDHAWIKQYGKGYIVTSIKSLKQRVELAEKSKLIRGGDFDAPF